ncbi:hypothetical protein N3K66_006892 [Trichothecium roseum]|uniref:Uncharacterized protein n=1 Tax=Trichothecium roseum TaxID=47278 RepID=A0ACC0UXW8_9HYPO|nr:hypothetical protein N3K66_006892 [Trichothecium roseum]
MGRELQKKKRRSGRQPVRQPNRPKNPVNPLGNSTVARAWDRTQTLAQNYRRLGLAARLKGPTGGTETSLLAGRGRRSRRAADPLAISAPQQTHLSEAKVERDADGKIVRIISRTKANPLNDPLNDIDTDSEAEQGANGEWAGIGDDDEEEEEEEQESTGIVKTLEAEARNEAPKKKRHQSEREVEWLSGLVARHGDDYDRMARDRKLNPMQQTAADIRKRVLKMQS